MAPRQPSPNELLVAALLIALVGAATLLAT